MLVIVVVVAVLKVTLFFPTHAMLPCIEASEKKPRAGGLILSLRCPPHWCFTSSGTAARSFVSSPRAASQAKKHLPSHRCVRAPLPTRCKRHFLASCRLSTRLSGEANRRAVEAKLVERANSAVELFALVNAQLKVDAMTAGRGASTLYLRKRASASSANGTWSLGSASASDKPISEDDTAVVRLVKDIFE
jgi:hypothetical protein